MFTCRLETLHAAAAIHLTCSNVLQRQTGIHEPVDLLITCWPPATKMVNQLTVQSSVEVRHLPTCIQHDRPSKDIEYDEVCNTCVVLLDLGNSGIEQHAMNDAYIWLLQQHEWVTISNCHCCASPWRSMLVLSILLF